MDNVTHSLAAVLLAEAVCAARRPPEGAPRFRAAALAVSLLANNLPDLDFVYRRITPGKLGYLLHHRGHTHTLVGASVLSVVALALVFGWSRLRRVTFDAPSWRLLAGLSLFGSGLHIVMDFQNNYGVHPFWPIDDRWVYGDTLFIVEPLLWCAAVPTIAFLARTRIAAAAVVALLAVGLALGAGSGAVSASATACLVVVAAGVALTMRALSRQERVWFGLGAWLVVTGSFVCAGRAAARLVARSSARIFATSQVVDNVLTPFPGNPLCWSVISVGRQGEQYFARRGVVSIAPTLLAPDNCPSLDGRTPTAPLAPLGRNEGGVLWRDRFSAPLAELRALPTGHCDAAAFFRYARAPFWTSRDPVVVGDLRFDRSRELEFAEMELSPQVAGTGTGTGTSTKRNGAPETDACPPNVPPWDPPRADLLALP